MKNFLKRLGVVASLFFDHLYIVLVSLLLVAIFGAPLLATIGIIFLVAAIGMKYLPEMQTGAAFVGVLKEIWIDHLMEKFYPDASFLNGMTDMSEFVEYNIIHAADIGADPIVLLNNTVYPIATVERPDADLPLPLNYYDTVNTVIRNAEEVQLAYNKLDSVLRQHQKALLAKISVSAAFNAAPLNNTNSLQPLLITTGAASAVDGLYACTLADIANLQLAFDNLNVPADDRILVLNPRHYSEILKQDALLFKMFSNAKEGEVLPLFGFNIYKSTATPSYNYGTGVKIPLGAVGSDVAPSSIAFAKSEVMKADGTVDMFYFPKSPTERGDVIGFQKRFLSTPLRGKFFGAVYSGHA